MGKRNPVSIIPDKNRYDYFENTIATATTNSELTLTVDYGVAVIVSNDNATAGQDLIVRFNNTSAGAIKVKAGETLNISSLRIQKIYLSNSSGATISYRIILFGE